MYQSNTDQRTTEDPNPVRLGRRGKESSHSPMLYAIDIFFDRRTTSISRFSEDAPSQITAIGNTFKSGKKWVSLNLHIFMLSIRRQSALSPFLVFPDPFSGDPTLASASRIGAPYRR